MSATAAEPRPFGSPRFVVEVSDGKIVVVGMSSFDYILLRKPTRVVVEEAVRTQFPRALADSRTGRHDYPGFVWAAMHWWIGNAITYWCSEQEVLHGIHAGNADFQMMSKLKDFKNKRQGTQGEGSQEQPLEEQMTGEQRLTSTQISQFGRTVGSNIAPALLTERFLIIEIRKQHSSSCPVTWIAIENWSLGLASAHKKFSTG